MEQKVKQAAQSLNRLEITANKRQRITSAPYSTHLETAQKKCDEITEELWRLTSLSMDVERKLLNHNIAVLGLSMNILEKKDMESVTDDFGEGHLYASTEGDHQPKENRHSFSAGTTEMTEVKNRLRELNLKVASDADAERLGPPPDTPIGHIEQLEESVRLLIESHAFTTRNLQTSLSQSQGMIEQLKLRERDQSVAIIDHTARNEDLDRRLIQTQKEFDRVQNELEEREMLIVSLKNEVQRAEEEVRIAETAAAGREAEGLRREKSLRRQEVDRLNDELAQKDARVIELTQQLDTLRSQFSSAQKRMAALQSELSSQSHQHERSIRELESEFIDLKSENAMLKAEKDEILGSRRQRAEEARLQRELEESRFKSRSSEFETTTLLAEIESLKTQNSQLTRELEVAEMDRTSVSSNDSSREKELESRCSELQTELSSILDDFERLTSQFIDHESFRQTLEAQIDGLRSQCHNLQTELAEERVRVMGRNHDVGSSGQGVEQTSVGTLRSEFRKMVQEMRNEHIAALKVTSICSLVLTVGGV